MGLLYFLLGAALGVAITMFWTGTRTATGTLRIDRSNPEKDVHRLDIGNFDDLYHKDRIVIYIDRDADLSQK